MGKYNIVLLLVSCIAVSCIRPHVEDCPPLKISVEVEDKNYFNIKDAALLEMDEVKDENLPFRDYISTVYYVVKDADGKVVAEAPNYTVEGDGMEHVIILPAELPYGKYSVVVWGNMKSDRPLNDESGAADLEAAAFNDIYMGETEVLYEYGAETFTLPMKRTKGKLLIKVEGIPENINFSRKTISNVYTVVTPDFEYGKTGDVVSDTRWQERGGILTHTPVCPTAAASLSELNLTFADTDAMTGGRSGDEETRIYIPTEPVSVKIGRNELTVLRYHYDDRTDKMDVYVMVNDHWEIIHSMVMD